MSEKPEGIAQTPDSWTSSRSDSDSVNSGQGPGTLVRASGSSPGRHHLEDRSRDLALKSREERTGSGWAMCWASEQGPMGPPPFLHTSASFCPSCLPSTPGTQLQAHPHPEALHNSPHLPGGSTAWATWLWFHDAPFLLPVRLCPGFGVGVGDDGQVLVSFLTSSTSSPSPQLPPL